MLLMNGAQVQSAPIFGQLGLEWENVAAGELSGEGKADILFRPNTDGSVFVLLMNGAEVRRRQSSANSALSGTAVTYLPRNHQRASTR